MEDDYLAHYGVLGMKWGVRKSRVSPVKSIRRKYDSLTPKQKTRVRDVTILAGTTAVAAALSAGTATALFAAGVTNPAVQAAGSAAVGSAIRVIGHDQLVTDIAGKLPEYAMNTVGNVASSQAEKAMRKVVKVRR